MIYKQRIKPRLIDPSILYKINVAHGWRINGWNKFFTHYTNETKPDSYHRIETTKTEINNFSLKFSLVHFIRFDQWNIKFGKFFVVQDLFSK